MVSVYLEIVIDKGDQTEGKHKSFKILNNVNTIRK